MLEKLIISIVTFSIISTMLGNMIQDSAYKKYVSGFAGILFVIMIINPILSMFDDGMMEKMYDKCRFIFAGDDYRLDSTGWEKEYANATKEQYEEIVKNKIQTLIGNLCQVNKCEIEYEESMDNGNYGAIYQIRLRVGMIDNINEKTGVKEIEKVNIGEGNKDKTDSRGYKEMTEKIKESISDYFELDKENIIIEYQ